MADTTKKGKKREWKDVPLDNPGFFSGEMDGFVSLETLDDYQLESLVSSDGSRVKTEVKRQKKEQKKTNEDKTEEKVDVLAEVGKKKKKKKRKKKLKVSDKDDTKKDDNKQDEIEDKDDDDIEEAMSEWASLGVPPEVLKALSEQGFTHPTAIQALAIPPAIFHHRDIIGAAETGSGKTLAFGIPIIHHILASKLRLATGNDNTDDNDNETEDKKAAVNNPLMALIMTPTRELALQIKEHLVSAAKYTSLKVTGVVGGMAPQKQQRLLKQCPEIVVATPGRLWELISSQEGHVSNLGSLRYLVIDEADRMIEQGHYEELSSILDLIQKEKSGKQFDSCYPEEDKKKTRTPPSTRLQRFIFSATLTLPKSFKRRGKEQTLSREELLASLMEKMNMEKKKCKVVDVTTKKGTVETLTEAKITCNKEEKDAYLYYFLQKYPGRTLVFTNTIDCIRRLASILRLLQLNPLPLHASMQQRQRLKNLDRFKTSENGLLIATDVAARGLDIPKVQHVIHYQVPKDPEIYIHRSGRTARALNEGLSVVLVGPDDLTSYRKIMKTLNKGEELQSFPIEIPYLADVKTRTSLSRQIDQEEHKVKKKKSSNDWFLASAKAMDIMVDNDLLEDLGDSREKKQQQNKLDKMRGSLAFMLKTPLIPKGFSGKFPTKSGTLVVPGIQAKKLNTKHTAKAAVDEAKEKTKKKRIT